MIKKKGTRQRMSDLSANTAFPSCFEMMYVLSLRLTSEKAPMQPETNTVAWWSPSLEIIVKYLFISSSGEVLKS